MGGAHLPVRRSIAVLSIVLSVGCATTNPLPIFGRAEVRPRSAAVVVPKKRVEPKRQQYRQPTETRRIRPMGWPTERDYRDVSSEYGPRARASGGPYKQHRGIDILAAKGSDVVATAPGKVIFSGSQNGYGKLIGIAHADGYETWYAHLDTRIVQVGDTVALGQRIGCIGRTGNATAYHVHYEVRKNGTAVDPRPYLN